MSEPIKRLMEVYTVVKLLGGKGNSRRIAEILGVSERTVQRYLKLLVERGYVEPVRYGMRLYYRVVKPLTEHEAIEILKGTKKEDAFVYQLAKSIDNIIEEGMFRADLIGAAKIHFLVPSHSRITHGIDIVVAREHASLLVTTLKYAIGLILEKKGGIHADYKFNHPTEDIKVDVMVDGFKENGVMVWNLAPVLRKGRLSLEHVLLAKLTRRAFREDADAYDVAVSLPHINVEKFVAIYRELKRENPALAERVDRHFEIVQQYVLKEYTGVDADIILKVLARVRNAIKEEESELNYA